MKYEDIIVTPLHSDRFKLINSIVYKDIVVPAGYCTNGANIPRLFWAIWPPNRSDYLPAVIVHDYLCDKEEYEKADEYFLEIMTDLKVKKSTRTIFHRSVRFYHWMFYTIPYKYFKKEM